MKQRSDINNTSRWVVKVGSALLTNDGEALNQNYIVNLVEQIVELRKRGIEVVLVSSGSIAAGVSQLNMSTRPEKLNELQAAAAVGQASLVRAYENSLRPFNVNIAQLLLTNADIANRERYLNAKRTLTTLLKLDVLAIVNENDTVATDEICFGDNDSLGALVANLIDADLLVILTDQDGLYTADPRSNPNAELIEQADAGDTSLLDMATGGTAVGRGGMITKLTAAQKASSSGASTIIANGREQDVLLRCLQGELLGTLLLASDRLASKKQWLAGQMKVAASVTLDDGAARVLQQSGSSLLPVGVSSVNGEFARGELISCIDPNGKEIARGLSNYSSVELTKIAGCSSDQIAGLLGYGGDDELIHRDNLVLIKR